MRVYVETNFVLEMAFEQEQSAACEAILRLAEDRAISLVMPAFCFTELHGRLRRQNHERGELHKRLANEKREFERSSRTTEAQKRAWDEVSALLVSSTQEAEKTLDSIRSRLLQTAQSLPLTAAIVEEGALGQTKYGLQFPDALVLSSVLTDLMLHQEQSCFLNTNSKDFNAPRVVNDLAKSRCRPIWRFNDGLEHVRAMLRKGSG